MPADLVVQSVMLAIEILHALSEHVVGHATLTARSC